MISLALIAVLEAVVYFHRYRASHKGGALAEALTSLAICVLRISFVFYGVAAFHSDMPLAIIMLSYGVPAALATYLARRIADR